MAAPGGGSRPRASAGLSAAGRARRSAAFVGAEGRFPAYRERVRTMSRVGLVGGLGPESTIDYYRRILEAWQRERPGSAPSIVIDSVDVQHMVPLVEHDHPGLVRYLAASLQRLAGAGVVFAALSAN